MMNLLPKNSDTVPNDEGRFKVKCNVSDYTLGAVLSQKGRDRKWRPVDFMMEGMDLAQRNCKIYDKELLVIMTTLNKWWHHLLGAREMFEV
jgi:hypothetical protein